MAMIEKFTGGDLAVRNHLNLLVDEINRLQKISSDGLVKVSQTSAGVHYSISLNQLLPRIPKAALVFVALITDEVTGDYAWTEQRLDNTGVFEDKPDGLFGTTTVDPAKEFDGNEALYVTDFIVVMYQFADTDGLILYRFLKRIVSTVFPVKITQTGGSAGDKTTQCSFTYTVNTITGVEVATVQTPAKKRPSVGKLAAPAADSYGLAFYDGDTLVLYDANETLAPAACS